VQLRHVSLAYLELIALPPSLAALSQLSTLVLAGNAGWPLPDMLPPGAYQQSLRCLDLSEMVPRDELG